MILHYWPVNYCSDSVTGECFARGILRCTFYYLSVEGNGVLPISQARIGWSIGRYISASWKFRTDEQGTVLNISKHRSFRKFYSLLICFHSPKQPDVPFIGQAKVTITGSPKRGSETLIFFQIHRGFLGKRSSGIKFWVGSPHPRQLFVRDILVSPCAWTNIPLWKHRCTYCDSLIELPECSLSQLFTIYLLSQFVSIQVKIESCFSVTHNSQLQNCTHVKNWCDSFKCKRWKPPKA